MNRQEILSLLPYLFSLTAALGVFFYAWTRRQFRGVGAYPSFAGGQALVILDFILSIAEVQVDPRRDAIPQALAVENAFFPRRYSTPGYSTSCRSHMSELLRT